MWAAIDADATTGAIQGEGAGDPDKLLHVTPFATVPEAPLGLTASVAPAAGVGSGEVKLTWTAPADGGMAITDYVIESSTDGTSWSTVSDGVSTATTFTVGGLTNGTPYQFRVAALNRLGAGLWSATIQATPLGPPAAPTDLVAAVAPAAGVGSGEVKLTWTAPADGGAAITDYVIESSTDGTSWTTVSDGVSTATTFTMSGLTNGTTYRFRVTAQNAVGVGSPSAIVSATPAWLPAAPTGLVAAVAPGTPGVSSGEVRLTWTAPSNGGAAISDYAIQSSTNGISWTTIDDGVSTTPMYTVTGLTDGRAYAFRVAATNSVGTGPWSANVVATPRGRPAAPIDLTAAVPPAAGVGSGEVRLTWAAPPVGSAITDYVIERSVDGISWTTVDDGNLDGNHVHGDRAHQRHVVPLPGGGPRTPSDSVRRAPSSRPHRRGRRPPRPA